MSNTIESYDRNRQLMHDIATKELKAKMSESEIKAFVENVHPTLDDELDISEFNYNFAGNCEFLHLQIEQKLESYE